MVKTMKGLLIKDLQLLKSQKQTYIPSLVIGFIFIFFNQNMTFAATYMSVIISTIAYSTINMDQYGNGMEYLMTLPVSRSSYVREKYLLYILVTLLSVIIAGCSTVARAFIKHVAFQNDELLAALLTALVTSVLMQSVMIPTLLKFGADKSRIALTAILGAGYLIGFASFFLIKKNTDVLGIIRRISAAGLTVGLFAAMAAAIGISFFISLRVMKRKEF